MGSIGVVGRFQNGCWPVIIPDQHAFSPSAAALASVTFVQLSEATVSWINNADNAGLIHAIFQSAYRVEADLIGVCSFPPLEREVSDIQASRNTFYAARKGGETLGVVELEAQEGAARTIVIASLAVAPLYARQGVGLSLVQYVLALDATFLVTTARQNLPAIRLYERLGFSIMRDFLTPDGIPMVELVSHA